MVREKNKSYLVLLVALLIVFATILVACNETPTRVSIEYKDTDGSILKTYEINEGESIPYFDLPSDTVKWDYLEWTKTDSYNKVEFVAKRNPNRSYFVGNVFQIIGKDFMGEPILSGSGFVVDKNGYFVTNDHVMEDAYEVSAYFEIRNAEKGESYTELPVEVGYYNDADKDLFIGRITDYGSIAQYYQPIAFNTDYAVGGITYSVGYPNSVPNMEINEGKSYEDANFLADKIYGKVSFILSSSYIAHGSSGGILVDDNLDVVGITSRGWTDDNDKFITGGSISSFNVAPQVTNAKKNNGKYITNIYHPTELANMKFFRGLSSLDDARMDEYEGVPICINSSTSEGVNDSNQPYSCTTKTYMTSEYFIVHEEKYHWGSGDERTMSFYGYISDDIGIDSLTFEFEYKWANGNYYSLKSTDINYSETVSLTLTNYTLNKTYGTTVSESNITYAKERFNAFYDSFYYLLAGMWMNATNIDSDNRQIMLVGISADYPPFSYYEDGKLVGFEIELMNELCQEMGYEVEYVVLPFDELFSNLENDLVLSSISALAKTDSRDSSYTGSNVYYVEDDDSYVIYSALGNTHLTNKINNALAKIKSNGRYDELLAKYEL